MQVYFRFSNDLSFENDDSVTIVVNMAWPVLVRTRITLISCNGFMQFSKEGHKDPDKIRLETVWFSQVYYETKYV